jgi:signal transduction histidine kinase
MVKILDNGKGITGKSMFGSKSSALGISGMKQRIHKLGGVLVLRNTCPGTLVEAIIPLENPTSAAKLMRTGCS